MLYYNIYSHISDSDFLEIQKKLSFIEEAMFEILAPLGWQMTMPVKQNDALIIDFTIEDKIFFGNIGLTYIDEPGDHLFSFYVTKGYDELKRRYTVKHRPYDRKSISFFEENIRSIIVETLELYEVLDTKDMKGFDLPDL